MAEYQGVHMRGMKSLHGRQATKSYANGGRVRGPGTGTSDSIRDEVPEGTFIMPADSTAQIGSNTLAGMGARGMKGLVDPTGGKKVAVNLSNGEHKLLPKQVQAIGVETLNQMKDATHTPVAGGGGKGLGMKPELFFANGGWVVEPKVGTRGPVQGGGGGGLSAEAVTAARAQQQPVAQTSVQSQKTGMSGLVANPVTNPGAILKERERIAGFATGGAVTAEEAKRRAQEQAANQTAMYVEGAQAAESGRPAPVGTPTQPKPPAPVPQKTPGASQLFVEDRAQEMKQQAGAGNYAGAVGTGLRTAVQGAGMYGLEAADKVLSPWVDAGQRLVGGAMGSDTPSGKVQPTQAAPVPSAAATVLPTATGGPVTAVTTDVQRGSAAAPAATSQPQASEQIAPGVYKNAPGQYSDSATGMGALASASRQPSVQNMTAANNLATQQSQMPTSATGMGALMQAPTVRNSTNDWAARKALENAATAAGSITANGGRFDKTRKGQISAQAATYAAMSQNDLALQSAQPGMDQAAMRENSANQRAALQDSGATARLGMQVLGANSRDANRTNLAKQELGLRSDAQGFASRAAAQQEQLRGVLVDPNATAEQRRVAQRSLAALSGKTAADRMQVVNLPDTDNGQGVVMKGGQALVRTNEDGSVEQVPIGAQGGRANLPALDKNSQAVAIRDNQGMTREQKVEALKKLGYQG